MIAPADIRTEDFTCTTEHGGSTITARLVGVADYAVRAELEAYVKALHAAGLAAKVKRVVVDIRSLDLMNSSCLKAFVVWLGTLEVLPPADQYRIRFLADE